ncbi:MAG TPA: hypothetical protein VFO59_02675, partial [Dehalococcoidia bacterium]|nr:hypothetical protein [Dehalococcoidia bacterium]
STPEYRLFDEQWRSNTCDDKVDNDLDGLADNGDVGCRLNCKDFGPNERCKDPDLDGWLTYVEDRYGSNPNNPPSTPEGIPGTCNDGTDNDLDGDVDGGDSGCGISDCIDFDNEWGCAPL